MNEIEFIESIIKQVTLEIESYAISNMILMTVDEIEENLKRSYESDRFVVEYNLGKIFPKEIESKAKELLLNISIRFNRTVIANTYATQGVLIDSVVKTAIYEGKYEYETDNVSLYFTTDYREKFRVFMKKLLENSIIGSDNVKKRDR